MSRLLHVLLDEDEYLAIRIGAHRRRMTVAEWVRQALRKASKDHRASVEAKLRAVSDASRHEFPTADIDVMLREIEAGQRTK